MVSRRVDGLESPPPCGVPPGAPSDPGAGSRAGLLRRRPLLRPACSGQRASSRAPGPPFPCSGHPRGLPVRVPADAARESWPSARFLEGQALWASWNRAPGSPGSRAARASTSGTRLDRAATRRSAGEQRVQGRRALGSDRALAGLRGHLPLGLVSGHRPGSEPRAGSSVRWLNYGAARDENQQTKLRAWNQA